MGPNSDAHFNDAETFINVSEEQRAKREDTHRLPSCPMVIIRGLAEGNRTSDWNGQQIEKSLQSMVSSTRQTYLQTKSEWRVPASSTKAKFGTPESIHPLYSKCVPATPC